MRRQTRSLCVAGTLLVSCRTPAPPAPPEDITPRVTVTPERVPAGGPLALTYTWTVGPGARPIRDDYSAFVHFLDPEGVQIFSEAHVPTPPVTSWEPGHTYTYRRFVMTPFVPHVGRVVVVVGLFSMSGPGQRIALRGADRGRREYRVGEFVLLPRDRDLAAACEGLYPQGASAGAPFDASRFLRRSTVCSFPNPKEDVVLFLAGDIAPSLFPSPPTLTIAGADGTGFRVSFANAPEMSLRLRLPAHTLGEGPEARFRLDMNASYVPKAMGVSDDPRELSLRILSLGVFRARRLDPALLEGAFEPARLTGAAQ